MVETVPARRGRRSRQGQSETTGAQLSAANRFTDVRNTFGGQRALSEDRVAAIHETALRVLEELGLRVLNAEARRRLTAAGAAVDESTHMVRFDRGLVANALATAPSLITLKGGSATRTVTLGGDHIVFVPVGGPPHATDIKRGRRAGSLRDAKDFFRLTQSFGVLHMIAPNVEPQDVALNLRHLEQTKAQLTLSDKVPFVYARGSGQVADALEMVRLARGLTSEEMAAQPYCYTVINTNSPRQLDEPMCQGIMDFAAAGQVSFITPFTLAGAMAPISMAGALVLQHAEALAGVTLAQVTRPGAPVVYGSFTSNVDMKSGAPAFGTPEYLKATIAAGQLARHVGLPLRASAPTASNIADAQGAMETQLSLWACLLGGVNLVQHSAGWLEGGLSASFEKFILDVELLQIVAEGCLPLDASDPELAFEAIAETPVGGHFFSANHTLERFRNAFHEPMVADWRNFETWSSDGARTATERASDKWREIVKEFRAPASALTSGEAIAEFVARRKQEGGALPAGA